MVHGPDLPSARTGHCMVNLEDGRIMIIGGRPTYKDVLIYHQSSGSFEHTARLSVGRTLPACTQFHSPMHGMRPVIIVAGGVYGGRPFVHSAEVLDFTRSSTVWKRCKCQSFQIFQYFLL